MQLKTILNRVQKHSSFVYETVRSIEVEVRPRANARAKCSQCGRAAPGYDTLPPRCFAFVALWHIPVVFLYAMRHGCSRSKARGRTISVEQVTCPVAAATGDRWRRRRPHNPAAA